MAFVEFQLAMRSAIAEVQAGETTTLLLNPPSAAPVRLVGRARISGRPYRGTVFVHRDGAPPRLERGARTDEQGAFEVRLPGPGRYTLLAGSNAGAPALALEVPAVEEHRVDLELPSARIAGRIVLPSGYAWMDHGWSPLVELQVQPSFHGFLTQGSRICEATAPDFAFAFEGLAPGRYRVAIRPFLTNLGGAARQLELDPGAALEGIELRLVEELARSESGIIEGVVRGSDGEPVADATVYMRGGEGEVQGLQGRKCRADGTFLVQVPPGPCTLSARTRDAAAPESAPLDVRAGEVARVELVLAPATVLRVSASDAAGALQPLELSVRDLDGREHAWLAGPEVSEALQLEGLSATQRRAGPLAPGTYDVEARAGGRRALQRVVLAGEPERVLELVLE